MSLSMLYRSPRAIAAVRSNAIRSFAKEVSAAEQQEAAAEVTSLIDRSRAAQSQIENYTQEQVDRMIKAMVWSVAQPGVSEKIAQHTIDESRLGNYEGKFLKINRKTRAALMDIIDDKSVGILEEIPERNIIKIAKPIGRNSIVIAPHPRAKKTNKMIIDLMREAIVKCGGPADLVLGIDEPSLEKTNQLMKHCDRVLATGGGAMVTAAYSSGTPALGVGVGNAVVTVDDTANLTEAAEKIRISKTLDFAASCSADNSLLVFEPVYDEMLSLLQQQGGYLLNDEDKAKLQSVTWVDGHLNANVVAQPPEVIAGMAKIDVPEGIKFFIVKEEGAGPNHPFSGEKLSVTLTYYKVKDIDDAIRMTNAIQEYQGQGHSCGIYSNNDENILSLAANTKTSRVMVNQPQAASNSGNLWNGMRQTFSLGCGSWGGNSINNNITWRDLINETWVSKPLKETKVIPDDETLFGKDIMNM
eukprot:GSChrysophyteH1.ASY1.ANO1.1888.1 assembled CDS